MVTIRNHYHDDETATIRTQNSRGTYCSEGDDQSYFTHYTDYSNASLGLAKRKSKKLQMMAFVPLGDDTVTEAEGSDYELAAEYKMPQANAGRHGWRHPSLAVSQQRLGLNFDDARDAPSPRFRDQRGAPFFPDYGNTTATESTYQNVLNDKQDRFEDPFLVGRQDSEDPFLVGRQDSDELRESGDEESSIGFVRSPQNNPVHTSSQHFHRQHHRRNHGDDSVRDSVPQDPYTGNHRARMQYDESGKRLAPATDDSYYGGDVSVLTSDQFGQYTKQPTAPGTEKDLCTATTTQCTSIITQLWTSPCGAINGYKMESKHTQFKVVAKQSINTLFTSVPKAYDAVDRSVRGVTSPSRNWPDGEKASMAIYEARSDISQPPTQIESIGGQPTVQSVQYDELSHSTFFNQNPREMFKKIGEPLQGASMKGAAVINAFSKHFTEATKDGRMSLSKAMNSGFQLNQNEQSAIDDMKRNLFKSMYSSEDREAGDLSAQCDSKTLNTCDNQSSKDGMAPQEQEMVSTPKTSIYSSVSRRSSRREMMMNLQRRRKKAPTSPKTVGSDSLDSDQAAEQTLQLRNIYKNLVLQQENTKALIEPDNTEVPFVEPQLETTENFLEQESHQKTRNCQELRIENNESDNQIVAEDQSSSRVPLPINEGTTHEEQLYESREAVSLAYSSDSADIAQSSPPDSKRFISPPEISTSNQREMDELLKSYAKDTVSEANDLTNIDNPDETHDVNIAVVQENPVSDEKDEADSAKEGLPTTSAAKLKSAKEESVVSDVKDQVDVPISKPEADSAKEGLPTTSAAKLKSAKEESVVSDVKDQVDVPISKPESAQVEQKSEAENDGFSSISQSGDSAQQENTTDIYEDIAQYSQEISRFLPSNEKVLGTFVQDAAFMSGKFNHSHLELEAIAEEPAEEEEEKYGLYEEPSFTYEAQGKSALYTSKAGDTFQIIKIMSVLTALFYYVLFGASSQEQWKVLSKASSNASTGALMHASSTMRDELSNVSFQQNPFGDFFLNN